MPSCPARIRAVQSADRTMSANYKGNTHYFRPKNHKEIFQKQTDVFDRFLSKDAAAKSKSTILTITVIPAKNVFPKHGGGAGL